MISGRRPRRAARARQRGRRRASPPSCCQSGPCPARDVKGRPVIGRHPQEGQAARCFSIWRGGRWPSPSGNGPIKPSTVSTARSALTRPQILADVLGLPVHVPGISESAAAGADRPVGCAGAGAGAQIRRALRRMDPPHEAGQMISGGPTPHGVRVTSVALLAHRAPAVARLRAAAPVAAQPRAAGSPR